MKRLIALCVLLFLIGWALTIATTEAGGEGADHAAPVSSPVSVAASHRSPSETSRAVVVLRDPGTAGAAFKLVTTADGSTVKDLPSVPSFHPGDYPVITDDGKWVYFTSGSAMEDNHDIIRQSTENGGTEVVVSDGQQPAVNPSGNRLAFERDGVVVVRDTNNHIETSLDPYRFPGEAQGNVLAGVRSITWTSDDEVALLTSQNFQQFHVIVARMADEQMEVKTVRDSPLGQLIGPGRDDGEVTVIDDMNGLMVHAVQIDGAAAVRQRSVQAMQATVWDVTHDGQGILLTQGKELRRQSIEDVNAKQVLSPNAFAAGF